MRSGQHLWNTLTITERQRRNLFIRLEEVIGGDRADNLMQLLPRVPNDDQVTRADIIALAQTLDGRFLDHQAETKADFAQFRTEMCDEFRDFEARSRDQAETFRIEMRNEIGSFRNEIRGEFGSFKDEMRGEFGSFRDEIRSDFAQLVDGINGLQRWGVAVVAANAVATITALVT